MAKNGKTAAASAAATAQAAEPVETVLVLRTSDKDRRSHGGFQWPESGHVEAPDWNPEPHCGHGLHGLLAGIGNYDLLNVGSDETVQVVEVERHRCVDLNGKVKFPFGQVKFSGRWSGAFKLIAPALNKEIFRQLEEAKAKALEAPAATTGNYAPAATTGECAPAATTGYKAPAATTGNYAPAATTGECAPAAATGYKAPAATTGNYAPAATTGYKAPAATTGECAPAATTGYKAPAATTGNYAPAATTGNYAPAATTGECAPAATTGYKAPAATTGNYSIAAAIGVGGRAKAGVSGALMLARFAGEEGSYVLKHVFAGMIGQTFGDVTLQPNTWYQLNADGVPEVVE